MLALPWLTSKIEWCESRKPPHPIYSSQLRTLRISCLQAKSRDISLLLIMHSYIHWSCHNTLISQKTDRQRRVAIANAIATFGQQQLSHMGIQYLSKFHTVKPTQHNMTNCDDWMSLDGMRLTCTSQSDTGYCELQMPMKCHAGFELDSLTAYHNALQQLNNVICSFTAK